MVTTAGDEVPVDEVATAVEGALDLARPKLSAQIELAKSFEAVGNVEFERASNQRDYVRARAIAEWFDDGSAGVDGVGVGI